MREGKFERKETDCELDMAAMSYFNEANEQNLTDVIQKAGRLINYFKKIYGAGQQKDDLYQVGVEGLLKALKGFDSCRGASFSTYAGHCIMGEIRHFVRQEMSYYRPRVIERLREDIEELIEEEIMENGSFPEAEGIADKLNIRVEGIPEVMRSGIVPLNKIDLDKISNQKHESFRLPIEDRIVLEQAINKLSNLQKKVIHSLFIHEMTQEQTALILNMNRSKVSRLLRSGLKRLREVL